MSETIVPSKDEHSHKDCQQCFKELSHDKETSGLKHECGVFACIAAKPWPSHIDVAQMICVGLVALQHRFFF